MSEKTVADSMRRQGLLGRKPKRRKGLTRQDKTAPKFPDLLSRDFTAPAPNLKWCGDITEIPTDEGKLYLATVLDLYSRRLLACPTSLSTRTPSWRATRSRWPPPSAAARTHRRRHLPHRPRLDLHRQAIFTRLCTDRLGIRQSMGRVGSCFDNAAAESFFSTLE